jgi:hypothetical protein
LVKQLLFGGFGSVGMLAALSAQYKKKYQELFLLIMYNIVLINLNEPDIDIEVVGLKQHHIKLKCLLILKPIDRRF